jgi:hypothetical protein
MLRDFMVIVEFVMSDFVLLLLDVGYWILIPLGFYFVFLRVLEP